MNRSQPRFGGFTLVELLVSIAILGILIGVIIALTSGFLGFSRHVSVINDRLVDLNDAMGYVGLSARSSMRTYGNAVPASLRIDTETVSCTVTSPDGPCVAFLVPVVERDLAGKSPITGYRLLAYRIVPISDWSGNPGVPAGWADEDTPVLLEHRAAVACGASCDSVPSIPTPLVVESTALVIPDLFIKADDVPMALTVGDSQFTLSLRVAGSGQLSDLIVPSDGPLVLTAVRRP